MPIPVGDERSPGAPRSVLLLGATGLVGGECLRQLLADPAVGRVVVITRRSIGFEAGKLEQIVTDLDRLEEHAEAFAVDQIVCTLGTTIKDAGSREQFRRVDYDYPLAAARLGRARAARHFLLVTSIGANARSNVFYSRVKGELEDAVLALGYPSVTIVRPSLLLGKRGKRRLGEEIAKLFAPMIVGKYKPVSAEAVARHLVRAAKDDHPGHHIIESNEIMKR